MDGLEDGCDDGRIEGCDEGDTNYNPVGLLSNELTVLVSQLQKCFDVSAGTVISEGMYVKDNDTWEKDENNNEKIKMAIDHINKENAKQIYDWVEENPDSQQPGSKKNEQYMNILESTFNKDKQDVDKVIKNVSKNIAIDKNTGKKENTILEE